ncbi:hypothetical protein PAPHI01_0416 [Pancytospora philotis]|nr:hypothetical protein PAPHI01_0416 [Pancytospora philotis]
MEQDGKANEVYDSEAENRSVWEAKKPRTEGAAEAASASIGDDMLGAPVADSSIGIDSLLLGAAQGHAARKPLDMRDAEDDQNDVGYTPFVSADAKSLFIGEGSNASRVSQESAPKGSDNKSAVLQSELDELLNDSPVAGTVLRAVSPESRVSPPPMHSFVGPFSRVSGFSTPERHYKAPSVLHQTPGGYKMANGSGIGYAPYIYPNCSERSEAAAPGISHSFVNAPRGRGLPHHRHLGGPAPYESAEEIVGHLEEKIRLQAAQIESLQIHISNKDELVHYLQQENQLLSSRAGSPELRCLSPLIKRGLQLVQELLSAPRPADLSTELCMERNKTLQLTNTLNELLRKLSLLQNE